MQKIRNTFHNPLSVTRLVVGSGIALFLAGVFLIGESTSAAGIGAARLSFVWAGWVLTAGWVLKRVEDRQWPFACRMAGRQPASRRVCVSLACLFALGLGTIIWRSYGPLMRDPMPARVVSVKGSDAPQLFYGPQNFLPGPSPFLSLTKAAQPSDFDRIATGGDSSRQRGSRFRFSSQAMVAPPALSGKLPSTWDIQP